jgi:site-specific DNA recombinase
VLAGLKDRLMAPDLVAVFIEEFNAELRRIAKESEVELDRARHAIADVERRIGGIVKAIEDGAYNPTLKARLSAPGNEKVQAQARLASIPPSPILRLHPNLPALYRSKVEKLAEALSESATAAEASEIMRALIERIVLTPVGKEIRAELYGDFASIAAVSEGLPFANKNPGSSIEPGLLSLVAGTRNQLSRTVICINAQAVVQTCSDSSSR